MILHSRQFQKMTVDIFQKSFFNKPKKQMYIFNCKVGAFCQVYLCVNLIVCLPCFYPITYTNQDKYWY